MRNHGHHLGKIIRSKREARGVTTITLGKLINRDSRLITNCEKGNAGLALKHVVTIANYLKADLDEFLDAMVQDYNDSLSRELNEINKGVNFEN